ncbi:MAG: VCBS repeat-containing protein [Deltaproteobacteria bacterium]|nr:VCBS repeat-containing protein [Deltaproteobacteria bacterium]
MNRDGIPDVLALEPNAQLLELYLGNGDGGFRGIGSGRAFSSSTWIRAWALAVADFDGDGWLDVAVSGDDTAYAVLMGAGDGGFKPEVVTALSHSDFIKDIATADMNQDGNPDLILAIQTPDGGIISVLNGFGDGGFSDGTDLSAGSSAWALAVQDLNGDGWPDILLAGDGVTAFLNLGDGGFSANHLAAGPYPTAMTVADLNSDGALDLVVTEQSANTMGVLYGDGAGGFLPELTWNVPRVGRAVRVADFNGDGQLDIAAGLSSAPAGVAFLLGLGDGGFASPYDLNGPGAPMSMTTADMNGDGLADLIVGLNGAFGGLDLRVLTNSSACAAP